MNTGAIPEGLYTQEQLDYVNGVPNEQLKFHLLHQVRLRDNMEADRDAFQEKYNELLAKYKQKTT